MIDPASIRTASFSLTPTGYNPEEVDRFLAELADATPGSIELAELRNASFSLTPTGYNPEEVDQFLGVDRGPAGRRPGAAAGAVPA